MTDNLEKVSFTIRDIQILSKSLSFLEVKEAKVPDYEFKIGLEVSLDLENKVSIHIISANIVSKDDTDIVYADLKIGCAYEVMNFEQVSIPTEKGISLREDVLDLFNAVTIGTLRGILYSELRGTVLHTAVLPVLDVKAFVKDDK